jgi:hypothetical protein
VPLDRAIDGVDQTDFLLGRSERSAREGFPVFVTDRMEAVKWKNWKMTFYEAQRDCGVPPSNSAPRRSSIWSPIRRRRRTLPMRACKLLILFILRLWLAALDDFRNWLIREAA